MDYTHRLSISFYETIATINDSHKVYLVQHRETGKIFVKKILDVYNAEIYEYLFHHPILGTPNIVDFYEENGVLTLIEEYIPGETLQERMNTSDLEQGTITGWIINLCEILERLHTAIPPIIHRDIKPSNIIITKYDKVVLLDFNAAKHYHKESSKDTVLLGTKGYAAPEQYGFGSSSPQTDIYSVGIILKELSDSNPGIGTYYQNIILRCTQMNPSDRYHSVTELKRDLLQLTKNPDNTHEKASLSRYFFPGFRTKKPWKMVIATIVYLFILWLSMSLQVENLSGAALWFERIMCLVIMLSVIFGCFNYLDIQNGFPLCKNKNPLIHYLGVLILDIILVFSLFIIMLLVEAVFFNIT